MSDGLHVLVIAPGFPRSTNDGRYTFLGDHCKALVSQGCDVDVVAYDGTDLEQHDLLDAHLRVHRLPRPTFLKYATQVLSSRTRVPEGLDLQRYDVVACHTELGLPIAKEAKAVGRPRVAFVMHGAQGGPLKRRAWRFLTARFPGVVDQVFIVGPSLFEEAQHSFGLVPKLLPNGAALASPSVPTDSSGAFWLRSGRGSQQIVISTIAMLTERKGIDILLRAVAEAQMRIRDPLLCVIVGRGGQEQQLRALAHDLGLADSVRFLGHLDRGDVSYVLHKSDMFALCSRREPFGVAATEAALAGCLVLVSDAVDAQPLMDHENNWLIHPAGSVSTLRDHIVWAANHRELASCRARDTQSGVVPRASWERNAALFLTGVCSQ